MDDVFETYNESINGSYVDKTSFLPAIWGNSYISFLPERFVIYHTIIKRFIVYKSLCINGIYKFELVRTNRDEPYYLKVLGSPTTIPEVSYKVPFESTTLILWFANAYVCKRSDDELIPVMPIMNVSNYNYFHSLIVPSYNGYKIYNNNDIIKREYIQKYNTFSEETKTNILKNSKKIPFDVLIEHIQTNNISIESTKSIEIKPLPTYVKTLLIDNAISKEECCPITMEPISKETASVTTCFHVFETSSIETWLNDEKNNSKCPVCKQQCKI
jgi:hypothetical protein